MHKIAASSIECRMKPRASLSGPKDQNVSRSHGPTTHTETGIGLIIGNSWHIDAMLSVGPPDKPGTIKTPWRCSAKSIAYSDLGSGCLSDSCTKRTVPASSWRPVRDSDNRGRTTSQEHDSTQGQNANPGGSFPSALYCGTRRMLRKSYHATTLYQRRGGCQAWAARYHNNLVQSALPDWSIFFQRQKLQESCPFHIQTGAICRFRDTKSTASFHSVSLET